MFLLGTELIVVIIISRSGYSALLLSTLSSNLPVPRVTCQLAVFITLKALMIELKSLQIEFISSEDECAVPTAESSDRKHPVRRRHSVTLVFPAFGEVAVADSFVTAARNRRSMQGRCRDAHMPPKMRAAQAELVVSVVTAQCSCTVGVLCCDCMVVLFSHLAL